MDAVVEPLPGGDDLEQRVRIGRRVRLARQNRRLTLRELAARAGIPAASLQGVEQGRAPVTVRRLVAIAAALDVGTENLLDPTTVADLDALGETAGTLDGHWRTVEPLSLPDGLEAAVAVFNEVGYAAATLEMIASRAGMDVDRLRQQHPDTQAVLRTLFAVLLDDIRSRLAAALTDAEGTVQRFAHVVEALTLFHTHRRDLALVGQRQMHHLEPEPRERMRAARVATQRTLDATVLDGVADGEFTTTLPREAARAISTMCIYTTHWFDPAGPDTAEQVAEQHVRFALGLVGHRGEPA